jgi:iron uptake system EfeUOB component EfeO/EfeM
MQETASAAEAGLSALLIKMINDPVGERLSREAGTVRVKVDTAVEEIKKSVSRGINEIRKTSEDNLTSELGTLKGDVVREVRKIPVALVEQIEPRLAGIEEMQRAAAVEGGELRKTIDEALAESLSRARNQEARIEDLSEQGALTSAKTSEHFNAFEAFVKDTDRHRADANGRFSSIEMSIGDGIRAHDARIHQVLDGLGKLDEQWHARVDALDRQSAARMETLGSDVRGLIDEMRAQWLTHMRELDARGSALQAQMEQYDVALRRQNEQHCTAIQVAQAALEGAVTTVQSRQSKMIRLVYGSLGASAMAVFLLIVEAVRGFGH